MMNACLDRRLPALLVCAAALFASAAPAQAAALKCGQTMRTSVVLTKDLRNCDSQPNTTNFDGQRVGDNNVEIVLNGHTVDGVGRGVGIRNRGFDHIRIVDGHDRARDRPGVRSGGLGRKRKEQPDRLCPHHRERAGGRPLLEGQLVLAQATPSDLQANNGLRLSNRSRNGLI